jgi:ABC-type uncharacterized transport system involved in gliding motility auxiliary subunit
VSAAALNFDALRDRMSSGEARRAGKYGTSAILGTLLGIAILGMLGFMGTRYHKRFDWSETGVHTLSDQSQKVLANLESDVDVLALVSKIDEAPIRDLLDKYAYESPRFVVEYADPNVRPGLLEQFGIAPEQLGRGLVRVAIGEDAVEVTQIDESNVTNAMVKLTRTGEKLVYFLEGHGERPIEGEAGEGRSGYARAVAALRNENYRVEKLLLAAAGAVPDDADVVVIAGATRPLLGSEYEAIERYLEGGGSLLAMVDPRVRNDLVDRIGDWGVVLGDDIVVDRTLALFGRAMTPFAASYDPGHEITRELREPTLFHEVRSVTVPEGGAGSLTEIVFTGEASWGERDFERLDAEGAVALEEGDLPGPVPVAAAGTPALSGAPAADDAASEPRVAVYGDSDFASNEFIEAYRNRDLFVNTVNWLMGDVEAISVRPNQARASRFQLSSAQFRTIRSLSLFVLPEAIAVLGVFTWWSRRHPVR